MIHVDTGRALEVYQNDPFCQRNTARGLSNGFLSLEDHRWRSIKILQFDTGPPLEVYQLIPFDTGAQLEEYQNDSF